MYAHLAAQVAHHNRRCCPDQAWLAGLLAPLGWLAAAAVDPGQTLTCLSLEPPRHMAPIRSRRPHSSANRTRSRSVSSVTRFLE